MRQIGKNHPCSCRSGKKYKDCCLNRTYLEDLEKENLRYFDEKYMLSKIIKESESFGNFYKNEREKINRDLLWFKKEKLGSSMSYGILPFIEQKPYCIVGKASPITMEYEFDTAHELQHLICCDEGFKSVSFKDGLVGNFNNMFCRVINDMIYDPIVNSRIMKYGFNLAEYYKKGDEIQKRTIGKYPINKLPSEQVIFITTLYVKKTLDMRNLYPNINDEEVDFNQWIKKNYSDLIPTSKSILKLIEEIGYDTPQKAEIIFQNIIDSFKLNEILTINNL